MKAKFNDVTVSFINLFTEGLVGFFRSILSGILLIVDGIISLNFRKILKGIARIFVQAAFDSIIVIIQNIASIIQTILGYEIVGRNLNDEEKAELTKVFKTSLKLSKIRIKDGDIGLNNFLAPHTVGNTIYIPYHWLDENHENYKRVRMILLVHEAVHCWQYQRFGTNYMSESLWHQSKGTIIKRNRNEAYNFVRGIMLDKKWKELNPEQQAHLVDQAYYNGLFDDPKLDFVLDDGTDITEYVRTAIEKILNPKSKKK